MVLKYGSADGFCSIVYRRGLTSGVGRLLANRAHSSLALCNLGAVDMRRDTTRLVARVVARPAAKNDMVSLI